MRRRRRRRRTGYKVAGRYTKYSRFGRAARYASSYLNRRLQFAQPSSLTMIGGLHNPYPSVLRTKLCVTGVINSSGGANESLEVVGNGLFAPSPDFAGQPHYFDHFIALYKRYKVTGCRITYTVIDRRGALVSDSGLDGLAFMVPSLDSSITIGQYQEVRCAARTTVRNLKGVHATLSGAAGLTGNQRRYVTISRYFTTKRQFPVRAQDDNFLGSSTTNPVSQYHIHCGIVSEDGASLGGAGSWRFHIKVIYYCQFSGLKEDGPGPD